MTEHAALNTLVDKNQVKEGQVHENQLHALSTKRRKLAHVLICNGCCCGRTDKGRPEVPLTYLKTEWKNRKLLKSVQLTIAGCLGPCDLANVVSVQSMGQSLYLGKLTTLAEYEVLLEWATQCTQEDLLLPLPEVFNAQHFEQFRSPSCTPLSTTPDPATTNSMFTATTFLSNPVSDHPAAK